MLKSVQCFRKLLCANVDFCNNIVITKIQFRMATKSQALYTHIAFVAYICD